MILTSRPFLGPSDRRFAQGTYFLQFVAAAVAVAVAVAVADVEAAAAADTLRQAVAEGKLEAEKLAVVDCIAAVAVAVAAAVADSAAEAASSCIRHPHLVQVHSGPQEPGRWILAAA